MQAERDLNEHLAGLGRRMAEALCSVSGGFRERRVLAQSTEADGAEIIWNWAFLLSPTELAQFNACLERFHKEEWFPGLSLVPGGPWPP